MKTFSVIINLLCMIFLLSGITAVAASDAQSYSEKKTGKTEKDIMRKASFREHFYPVPETAWNIATIVLGCPTDTQITMSIYPSNDMEAYIEYGVDEKLSTRTDIQSFKCKAATHLTLNSLLKNTAYSYRFRYRKTGETEFQSGPLYHFHTQRIPGNAFTFELMGDTHPERTPKQHDPKLYEQTLISMAKDRPDFFLCIGDDFSVDKLSEVTAKNVETVYLRQVPYLGLAAHSSPLFLVNGNHEQAALCNLDGTGNNVAVWTQNSRNRYFPQPAPDAFYSGDIENVEHIGFLRDYYAWTWGDALFVVIDPYWHSKAPVDNVFGGGKKHRDLWDITLGDIQYKWLKKTLEESHAKYKFVFAHHINGTGRGGIEKADYYEWGGKGDGGQMEFSNRRPQWELPIHQLMAKNGVSIFFQGHDHVFARQEKDGVIYQTLPQPADPNYTLYNGDAYQSGDIFPNSGRVRVSVSPEKVRVEYIRSYLPADASREHPDGELSFKYEISSR